MFVFLWFFLPELNVSTLNMSTLLLDAFCYMCQVCAMLLWILKHLLLLIDSRLELLRFTCSTNTLANLILGAVGDGHCIN